MATARQPPGRPLAAPRQWWVRAALLLPLLLVASGCGPSGQAAQDDSGLRSCVEAAGYDWEQVWPPWGLPEPPPPESPYGDAAFLEVFETCLVETGLSEEGRLDGARLQEENRAILEYVSCMRERGWRLPDAQPPEGEEHPGVLQPPNLGDVDGVHGDDDRARLHRDSAGCGIPVTVEGDEEHP